MAILPRARPQDDPSGKETTVQTRTVRRVSYLVIVVLVVGILWRWSSQGGSKRDQASGATMPARPPGATDLGVVRLLDTPCGRAAGTRFNLESPIGAVPQSESPVDFLYNRIPPSHGGNRDLIVQHSNDWRGQNFVGGDEGDSIFVHRSAATSCSPDFEMASPPIAGMYSIWDPQVVADPNDDQFLFTDIRYKLPATGLGLRRIPAANFLNPSVCPNGSLAYTLAQSCAGTAAVVIGQSTSAVADTTGLAQDPRAVGSGTGAGDIYVAYMSADDVTSARTIYLAACKALFQSLDDCSPPILVSNAGESSPASPRVSVVPGGPNEGTITLTYNGALSGGSCANGPCRAIEIVVCTPNGAPSAPTCGEPKLITVEPNGFNSLSGNSYPITVWISHANRADGNTGQTTFAVWARCKIAANSFIFSGNNCPDADVVMAASTDLGDTWTYGTVDAASPSHQFQPEVTVDASTGITNMVYRSMVNLFNDQDVLVLRQIAPGGITPGGAIQLTTTPSSGNADPHLDTVHVYGDYLGISAKGTGVPGASHLYIGHSHSLRLGINGVPPVTSPDLNNHVSRFDY